MKIEIDKVEICQAIADYVANKLGKSGKFDISLVTNTKLDKDSKPVGEAEVKAIVKEHGK